MQIMKEAASVLKYKIDNDADIANFVCLWKKNRINLKNHWSMS